MPKTVTVTPGGHPRAPRSRRARHSRGPSPEPAPTLSSAWRPGKLVTNRDLQPGIGPGTPHAGSELTGSPSSGSTPPAHISGETEPASGSASRLRARAPIGQAAAQRGRGQGVGAGRRGRRGDWRTRAETVREPSRLRWVRGSPPEEGSRLTAPGSAPLPPAAAGRGGRGGSTSGTSPEPRALAAC